MENLDNLKRGFISKEDILSRVSEEDVFSLVFDEVPEEFELVVSPFREDNNPGCFFSRDPNTGILRFIDFANPQYINGIKMSHIDCFNAVQIFYNLSSFFETLEFIVKKLSLNDVSIQPSKVSKVKKVKDSKSLLITKNQKYTNKDVRYWKKFGITIPQLLSDKVYSVLHYSFYNYSTAKDRIYPRTLAYVFTDFKENKKKIYMPLRKGNLRFFTNCTSNDIGNINNLPAKGDILIITKSYKDCRVLRNLGYNSIWLQSENMFPSNNILITLSQNFEKIFIFFDNDSTGIRGATRLQEIINTFFPGKSQVLHLPISFLERGIKDPADMYYFMGQKNLKKFLEQELQ